MAGTDPDALLWVSPQLAEDEQHIHDRDWWLLERRHEDGEHWVEVARYRTREDAEGRLVRYVTQGVPGETLRVERVYLTV
jgi:putative SOS response-associated peptidase YedK